MARDDDVNPDRFNKLPAAPCQILRQIYGFGGEINCTAALKTLLGRYGSGVAPQRIAANDKMQLNMLSEPLV